MIPCIETMLGFINKHVHYLHTKCQYLTIFAAFGSVRPYWTVFFQAKGLTSKETGIVYSMQPFLSIIAAPLWAHLADKHKKHKQIFLALIGATVCFICLFIILPPRQAVLYGVTFGTYSIFMSPMFSFLDAQTLLRLEGNKSLYGKQRLWGAVGWGIASFLSGYLIDAFHTPYAIFISFFVFMTMFVLLAVFSPWVQTKKNANQTYNQLTREDKEQTDNSLVLSDTKASDTTETELAANSSQTEPESTSVTLSSSISEEPQLDEVLLDSPTSPSKGMMEKMRYKWEQFSFRESLGLVAKHWRFVAFLISLVVMAWINVLGNFLFIYLRGELDAPSVLLGWAMAVTVIMELPFFFYSKNMLHYIGIAGCTIVGHLALFTRAISYSFLTNPWWVLPIEITHGIAFSCIWTAGVTYFGQIAPKGKEATFQGFFAGLWNVGGGIWSLVGGDVYERYGPKFMFRGCAFLIALSLLLYIISIIGHVPKLQVEVIELKNVELEEVTDNDKDTEKDEVK